MDKLQIDEVITSSFNIYIDELLSYNTGLSDDKVIEISKECEVLFTYKDITGALEKSREYINFAQVYLQFGENEKALDMLHKWRIDFSQ
ncbi:hypothetical protein [Clostridium tyrobutyricum]|uniref:hypothetical protein n=1 Tax=Clostridium tyrobutyricum TaxID=1519 RepID=UPI0002EBFE75|nr:hypothetical protein [Clostridium tyrobutyricum]